MRRYNVFVKEEFLDVKVNGDSVVYPVKGLIGNEIGESPSDVLDIVSEITGIDGEYLEVDDVSHIHEPTEDEYIIESFKEIPAEFFRHILDNYDVIESLNRFDFREQSHRVVATDCRFYLVPKEFETAVVNEVPKLVEGICVNTLYLFKIADSFILGINESVGAGVRYKELNDKLMMHESVRKRI